MTSIRGEEYLQLEKMLLATQFQVPTAKLLDFNKENTRKYGV